MQILPDYNDIRVNKNFAGNDNNSWDCKTKSQLFSLAMSYILFCFKLFNRLVRIDIDKHIGYCYLIIHCV
jgi:hypothetical protein